ncbi:MAG: ATP synthase F0 subunit B [Candidatus Buchananbacteria bacterium RIFCSPHIGHO2_02_FULL_45_11b]|uniref:ATP synthase subunit b n=3 Tax=Candidatus Buchananiibacteriota TaxID=1817903 RepID=A0A1G1YBF0_9BACT|nr:MAG: ATP synthase F0 subunit B [Candidatus Buchananbacteria bacterium RIFCSPHIGHO2_01_FULL_46_12]OGY50791.1 MAG: ATP synthase F0 subunit B [Candidatus Buchananbacteria bacterium RIFCSPHIGHO2_02_FULL_45_11b]OGY55839.1 MAG: ATP synthase F0 subunit B [Candidatus Buchananbacteria bacterium RIFCSPLOWO2_02_FULL_46_11b]
MDSIISTFHIDYKLMLAQLVNFGIIVGVLWYFVFKPLAAKMTERTKTIEKSLDEARQIADNLKSSEQRHQEAIKAARQEAEKIIGQANALTAAEKQRSVETAKEEVKKVVAAGKKEINKEKEKMLAEVKTQVADLVVSATGKLLEKISDKKIDANLIKETLKEIS